MLAHGGDNAGDEHHRGGKEDEKNYQHNSGTDASAVSRSVGCADCCADTVERIPTKASAMEPNFIAVFIKHLFLVCGPNVCPDGGETVVMDFMFKWRFFRNN